MSHCFISIIILFLISGAWSPNVMRIFLLPNGVEIIDTEGGAGGEFTPKTIPVAAGIDRVVFPYAMFDWKTAFTEDCAVCLVTVLASRELTDDKSGGYSATLLAVHVDRVFHNETGEPLYPGKVIAVGTSVHSISSYYYGQREPLASGRYYMILRPFIAGETEPCFHGKADFTLGPTAYSYMPLAWGCVTCYSTMFESGYDVRASGSLHFHRMARFTFEGLLNQYLQERYGEPSMYDNPYEEAEEGEMVDFGNFTGWFRDTPIAVEELEIIHANVAPYQLPVKIADENARLTVRVISRRQLTGI